MNFKHLIFFDDQCSFCRKKINNIKKKDHNQILGAFSFSSYFAKTYLPKSLQNGKTLVLVENYLEEKRKIWIYAQAIYRIFFLLGGWRKVIGFLSFCPSPVSDFFYQIFVKIRHHF